MRYGLPFAGVLLLMAAVAVMGAARRARSAPGVAAPATALPPANVTPPADPTPTSVQPANFRAAVSSPAPASAPILVARAPVPVAATRSFGAAGCATPGLAAPSAPRPILGAAPGLDRNPVEQAERAGLFAPNNPAPANNADALAAWGPPPAPQLDPRRFAEAHWQGLELIPNTPVVAQALGIPPGAEGVIADDVSLPADLQGFKAGDLVTHIDRVPTPNLTAFVAAADRVSEQRKVELSILRDGQLGVLELRALGFRLGTANGETPPMILPGARMPHAYRGPCTTCHRIGDTGTLAVDQGDLMAKTAPTIRAGAQPPHRDRGTCSTCHQILP